ncbi:dihydroorotate dehydrogenase electron transfer subunit [Thiohalophilus thiocyanatoxydans]|uniref:Dihydroorotate oxidase B electron transfer subunit n=1 Tax=Thiohalophilus thiocyanatoxydans TaxID=381308 RepID=A0A4R8IU35_9GAMM|nr:dihydroorotate dehydrogenase electron transfer subunit [Thiohalophilus thiocyanatoxydans]TDY04158.1 dihydroorotate oxidase B electron transfer subunit [Thiohalophilus thiocyanatoxydans]
MNAALSQRETIFVEEAEILAHDAHPGDQYTLRLQAPQIAARALPGSFVHLTVNAQRPMRRPISIMRVDAQKGYVDLLYKVFGEGTALLAQNGIGDTLNLMGPIGKPFEFHADKKRPLLIGGGVGMPPMIFCADVLRQDTNYQPFVILGSEVPFPFQSQPSEFMVPGMPGGVIAAMPLIEQWNIPSRLTSTQGYPGCHDGYVTDLARHWLDSLADEERHEVEIFSCGPHPMLEAVARLAKEYDLPCQVSLEEFMACAVGGCAGCVVQVQTEQGPAMKRVCVDGPVFDAYAVF